MKAFFNSRKTVFLYRLIFKISLIGLCCFLSFYTSESFQSTVIPRKIHYVWFGSKQEPLFVQKAMETWKKYLPDYQIIRWDESNCPIEESVYAQNMLKQKKWQFLSDFCRLYAIEKEGGVYLDTDMFLNAPLEPYLTKPLVLALERAEQLSAGIFAACPHHPYIKAVIDVYYQSVSAKPFIIPPVMTKVFQRMYGIHSLRYNFLERKNWIVYNPNILMLNFGGGENVAEHWYANGDEEYKTKSLWYKIFQNKFLEFFGYFLIRTGGDNFGMILLSDNTFYLISENSGL